MNIFQDLDYLASTLGLPRWSRAVDCCAKEGENLEKLQQLCPLVCFHLAPFFLQRVEPQEQMQDLRHSWTKCNERKLRLDACKIFGKWPLCLRCSALSMDLSCGTWQWAGQPSHIWCLPQELLQDSKTTSRYSSMLSSRMFLNKKGVKLKGKAAQVKALGLPLLLFWEKN